MLDDVAGPTRGASPHEELKSGGKTSRPGNLLIPNHFRKGLGALNFQRLIIGHSV